MTSKLDASLDDILKTRRQTNRRGRGGRRSDAARPATNAPVGGVTKSTKQNKANKPAASSTASAGVDGSNRLLISGLPHDVDQTQLQDYFASAVGTRPKKVLLQYGPSGRSLGSATVIFNRHDQAVKATSALNGVKIDNRPVRVEMLVSATNIPPAAAQATLSDRVTQSKKDKPKPATAAKATPTAAGKGRGGATTRGRGRGRAGRDRPKKKTLEELDAEMADYFPTGEGANDQIAANGAATGQAAAGDTAMDDEML